MAHASSQIESAANDFPAHERRLAVRINDAAAMLGISRSSVYELIAEGKLQSARIAGRRVIPFAECQRLLSESVLPSADTEPFVAQSRSK